MTRAITTVGVSKQRDFTAYHARFISTMESHGKADDILVWSDSWPKGSPSHTEVHYAFKVHAVEEARAKGHRFVLWLDVSCHALRSLEPLWKRIEEMGWFFLVGWDLLGNWSSDHCLSGWDITRDEAMKIKLFSGTIMGFDFHNPKSLAFLSMWKDFATAEHFNGTHRSGLVGPPPETEGAKMSSDPRCQGHRCDEPYTTLIAKALSMEPAVLGDLFCGGFDKTERCVIASGYDL